MGCYPTVNLFPANPGAEKILNNGQLHAALDDARADGVAREAVASGCQWLNVPAMHTA